MDLLRIALTLGAAALIIAWCIAGWLVRRTATKWERRFKRHPIATTLALVAIFRRRTAVRQQVRPAASVGDDFYRTCPISPGPWDGDPNHCRWDNRPLTGRSDRWCTPRCRRTAEANHVWSKARDAALVRDGDACTRPGCGIGTDLEVHHLTAVLGAHDVDGCHHHLAGLLTLCRPDHQHETNEQRRNGVFR
jgi:hypothetical protein